MRGRRDFMKVIREHPFDRDVRAEWISYARQARYIHRLGRALYEQEQMSMRCVIEGEDQ